jgi:uncharacterized membrane-anchored protein
MSTAGYTSTQSPAAEPIESRTERLRRETMRKLPQVTALFWVMKILSTTVGETGGDMLAQSLKLGYFVSTVAMVALLFVTVAVQLRSDHYNPFYYWTVILSTTMAGTTISDFMSRDASAQYLKGVTTGSTLGWGPQGLGLGYPEAMVILLSLLGLVFVIWKLTGWTFDIEKITTFRAEGLFWTAILLSNTLGTAIGDYLSDSSGLGYAGSAELILGVLTVILVLRWVPPVPNTALFWAAFVLTRPLGATVGDLFTKPPSKGGMGLGTYGATAVLLGLLYGLTTWEAVKARRKRQELGELEDRVHRQRRFGGRLVTGVG